MLPSPIFRRTLGTLLFTTALLQGASSPTEPTIKALRGRIVTVEVPSGFASVNVQVLTAPLKGKGVAGKSAPTPQWKSVASRLVHGQPLTASFRLPKLTPRRNIRVFGQKPNVLPASLLTGATSFAADLTSTANTGGSAGLATPGATMSATGSTSLLSGSSHGPAGGHRKRHLEDRR